jgi:hypothetical protein
MVAKFPAVFPLYSVSGCGLFPAGTGRPALPDQPEEEEDDPVPMPVKRRALSISGSSPKKVVHFISAQPINVNSFF